MCDRVRLCVCVRVAVAVAVTAFAAVFAAQKPSSGVVFACSEFAPWQVNALRFLSTIYQDVRARVAVCSSIVMCVVIDLPLQSTPHFPKSALSDMNKVVPTDAEMKKYPKVCVCVTV